MSQIIIGFTTEGQTDVRLLESIIQRTFIAVGMECSKPVEVIEPIINVSKTYGANFIEQMQNCAQSAFECGIMAFCIHIDADDNDEGAALENKIKPLLAHVESYEKNDICKNIIPVIPIYMSEAWMLADKTLLKDEIGTNKSDAELGISDFPEKYNDPKSAIEEAIRIALADLPKRRRNTLKISELYQPIGQKIDLEKLEKLPSYLKFKEATRQAYRNLNYLQ